MNITYHNMVLVGHPFGAHYYEFSGYAHVTLTAPHPIELVFGVSMMASALDDTPPCKLYPLRVLEQLQAHYPTVAIDILNQHITEMEAAIQHQVKEHISPDHSGLNKVKDDVRYLHRAGSRYYVRCVRHLMTPIGDVTFDHIQQTFQDVHGLYRAFACPQSTPSHNPVHIDTAILQSLATEEEQHLLLWNGVANGEPLETQMALLRPHLTPDTLQEQPLFL